jgi:sugar O-acyltransferase (sialic acid O-acetyltransferase NeuD family)
MIPRILRLEKKNIIYTKNKSEIKYIMKPILIIGTGGAARLAYDEITKKKISIFGFVEFKKFYRKKNYLNKPVIKFEEITPDLVEKFNFFYLKSYDDLNELRSKNFLIFKKKKFKFISYISDEVKLDPSISVGENTFILGGQTICSDVKIGNNVVIWSHNHIGDRTTVEDHVWISSSVSIGGDAVIGIKSFLGLNSTICNSVKIAKENFIGANALITKNTNNYEVFIEQSTAKLNINSKVFFKTIKF